MADIAACGCDSGLLKVKSPPSSSSRWTGGMTGDECALELGVKYYAAPFGSQYLGKTSQDAYLNLLHGGCSHGDGSAHGACRASDGLSILDITNDGLPIFGAGIQLPRKDIQGPGAGLRSGFTPKTIERYKELLSVLDPIDMNGDTAVPALTRNIGLLGSPWAVSPPKPTDLPENMKKAFEVVEEIHTALERCYRKLKEKERVVLEDLWDEYLPAVIVAKVRSYERMAKFLMNFRKCLQRCQASEQLDEDAFKILFMDFAYLFRISFRTMTVQTRGPLVICGKEVAAVPDLIYEKLNSDWDTRSSKKITVVTVGKIKREVRSSAAQASHSHLLGKRTHSQSTDSIEGDGAVLPDDLRGQHALQLISELPRTGVPNKKCMLGFVVQCTKVRLTCLYMEEDHLKRMEERDFQPSDFEARIYFTMAYDMLNKSDRGHLSYILEAIASLSSETNENLF